MRAALLAISLLVVAAGCGSDESGGGNTDDEQAALDAATLVAKADRICASSRARYAAIEAAPVATAAEAESQATGLAEVAGSSFDALSSLRAPRSLATDYLDYVAARGRMRTYLIEARTFAASGDLAGFEHAKALIDAEQLYRYEVARRVGFKQCSPRP